MTKKTKATKAAQWGSQGGRIGGPARAKALTPKRRTEIARQGGKARQRMKGK